MSLTETLTQNQHLFIKQRFEMAEFIGFETRNKYDIQTETQKTVAYAAEQNKGFMGFVLRQFLGHWRRFEIIIFDENREPVLTVKHPFRFLFQRLDLHRKDQELVGSIQQRFAIFRKRFDLLDAQGRLIMEMRSPLWRIWTFFFFKGSREVGRVEKKWSGLFSEITSDRDNFHIQFTPELQVNERALILASAIFIDLNYFEHKAQ